MPLTTATLSGPASGNCGFDSANFEVDLDGPAPTGGLSVAITSSVGADTITSTPLVIPAGSNFGFFTVAASSLGSRNISIATTPSLAIAGSPRAYNAVGNCPDDTGANNRVASWPAGSIVCGDAFSARVSITPSTLYARELYCSISTLSFIITE